jgi:hypothetical protein
MADRDYGVPSVPADFITIAPDGAFVVRYCVQPPGWPGFHGREWAIDADQLAIDIVLALLVPVALGSSTGLELLPVASAVAFSGYEGKALAFANTPRAPLADPFSSDGRRAPTQVGTLAQGTDALPLALGAIRSLVRFMGRRGADAWAEMLPDRLRVREELRPWHVILGL